jgi:hypothetical protein
MAMVKELPLDAFDRLRYFDLPATDAPAFLPPNPESLGESTRLMRMSSGASTPIRTLLPRTSTIAISIPGSI